MYNNVSLNNKNGKNRYMFFFIATFRLSNSGRLVQVPLQEEIESILCVWLRAKGLLSQISQKMLLPILINF